MSKVTVVENSPPPEAILENRLAQAIAHNILRTVAAMIHRHHLLNVAFQDQETSFSLAVGRLEQESYSPSATLEAVKDLYDILLGILETYREDSDDPAFQIPPNLRDTFDTKMELVEAEVLEEIRKEKVHETAKQVILGKEKRGITGVDLQIRKAVVAEIMTIIDFAMQDCVLEMDGGDYAVAEILAEIKNSAILALVLFSDNLLLAMKKAYPETGKRGQVATVILEVRRQIRKKEVPAPKKRRERKIENHPLGKRLENCDIGTVRGIEGQTVAAYLQRHTLPESTDAPADLESSPDEK